VRKAVLVVAQDFVGWPGVSDRQAGEPLLDPADAGSDLGPAATSLTFQPFPQGRANRFGNGLAGRLGQLASEPIGLGILDAERHYYIYLYQQV
jgi:hypothetical protein